MSETHEFSPDWTLPPAALLQNWLEYHGADVITIAGAAGTAEAFRDAVDLIMEVIDRGPLTGRHAAVLERGTGIPARTWLSWEQRYRADLAAGRNDVIRE